MWLCVQTAKHDKAKKKWKGKQGEKQLKLSVKEFH